MPIATSRRLPPLRPGTPPRAATRARCRRPPPESRRSIAQLALILAKDGCSIYLIASAATALPTGARAEFPAESQYYASTSAARRRNLFCLMPAQCPLNSLSYDATELISGKGSVFCRPTIAMFQETPSLPRRAADIGLGRRRQPTPPLRSAILLASRDVLFASGNKMLSGCFTIRIKHQ